MTWAKVCDTLHAHPKALDAGLDPMGLWVLALSHSAAYDTDGHVSRAAGLRIAGERTEDLASRLVEVRLWEPHPSGDGWQIHDYLAFNPSRAQVQEHRSELSRKRAEAGRRGAAERWQLDGNHHGNHHGKADGKRDGNCHSKVMANDGPDPDPDPDPDPVPIPPSPPVMEDFALTRVEGISRAGSAKGGTKAKRRAKHTPEEIVAKNTVVECFVECFRTKKGVEPRAIGASDHAAAFRLAKTYGTDEAIAIVRRAFEDTFVVDKNATLTFIGSKSDTYRGTAPAPKFAPRHMVQPATGAAWTVGIEETGS